MIKVIHGLIGVFFSIGCWFLWAMLTMVARTAQAMLSGAQIPAFTRLCLDLRPVLALLPIMALAYCFYVWLRRKQESDTWVGFFAGATAALVLLLMPTVIAVWLPLIAVLQKAGGG